ncbi:MAG: bromoperoxidase [Planctomycetota bacterium]
MKLPYSEPEPAGCERAEQAKAQRELAAEISRTLTAARTQSNQEEADHSAPYPANFTKGLRHNENGLVDDGKHYEAFVEAINSPDPNFFNTGVETASKEDFCTTEADWRGWESPRAGHVYDLQGADAGAVGMAPAPRVGSSELAAEMAEVYSLAILRDVSFENIRAGKGTKIGDLGSAGLSAKQIVNALNSMAFFDGKGRASSTPNTKDSSGLNHFERNRLAARYACGEKQLSTHSVFRGSTPGAMAGPYISQFMLIGSESIAGCGGGRSSFPGTAATFDLQDGFIPYGSLVIDQRTITHRAGLDHMTNWCRWLDVQNGAALGGTDQFESERRFITTPRDLATYVHYDALYEAYLNACLIMLSMGVPFSKGFPEGSGVRTPFATFGGPHILSLVTEVATRCLKAVRRQKFNYHRRARPEAMGGRLTLSKLGAGAHLGNAEDAFERTLKELPDVIVKAIVALNKEQNESVEIHCVDEKGAKVSCLPTHPQKTGKTSKSYTETQLAKANLLLPMAFPEGSPMHPAYGAGHATVAGGCVTMLKAFFEMFEDNDSFVERKLRSDDKDIAFVPTENGKSLKDVSKSEGPLTIQGELDKLAANISIGRNMAGVHYYSDYYDSLRLGERVAVSILMEQAPTYGETVESTFTSFDGDHITISGNGSSCPSLTVIDRHGNPVQPKDWWSRHVVGEEPTIG